MRLPKAITLEIKSNAYGKKTRMCIYGFDCSCFAIETDSGTWHFRANVTMHWTFKKCRPPRFMESKWSCLMMTAFSQCRPAWSLSVSTSFSEWHTIARFRPFYLLYNVLSTGVFRTNYWGEFCEIFIFGWCQSVIRLRTTCCAYFIFSVPWHVCGRRSRMQSTLPNERYAYVMRRFLVTRVKPAQNSLIDQCLESFFFLF